MWQTSIQIKNILCFTSKSKHLTNMYRQLDTLATKTALVSKEKSEYPVFNTGFVSKNGLAPIQPAELEASLKQAAQPCELFDVLLKSSAFFQPQHLECFIKRLTLMNCYEKNTNKYSRNSVAEFIPPEVNRALVKQIIKLAPTYEFDSNIEIIERLILLGFGSQDLSVKGFIQLLKHQINSFDLKTILRVKKILSSLSSSIEVDALNAGLVLAVRAKKTDIHSPRMRYTFLSEFPDAYTHEEFESALLDLIPDWHLIVKNRRIELTETILKRSGLSFELLKRITKLLSGYFKQKREILLHSDVDDNESNKVNFLNLMPSLMSSMINANFCDTSVSTEMINIQIDVLRGLNLDSTDEGRLLFFANTLNKMLAFCLKFNIYSLELLLLVYTKGLIDENLSLNSLLPELQKDLFLVYAGQCEFKNITDSEVEVCLDYMNQNRTDQLTAKENILRGLFYLGMKQEKSNEILVREIFANKEVKNEKFEIGEHLKKLLAVNESEYEVSESGEVTGDYESLADFVVIDKRTNRMCFVYIENRGENFRNTGKPKAELRIRLEMLAEIVENRKDRSILWFIKRKDKDAILSHSNLTLINDKFNSK